MATNQDRAERWVDVEFGRETRNFAASGNVWGEPGALYSYGRHFTMAETLRYAGGGVRGFLLNGDTYSVSTTQHQGIARAACEHAGVDSVVIPFSALDAAGVLRSTVEIVDAMPARTEFTQHSSADKPGREHVPMDDPTGRTFTRAYDHGRRHDHSPTAPYLAGRYAPATVPDPSRVYVGRSHWKTATRGADGLWTWETSRHWLGGSVIRAKVRGRRERAYFISGFDDVESRALYFLAELPRGSAPATYAQAIYALRPEAVRAADGAGLEVFRQGDVFAIPTELSTRELRKLCGNRGKPAPTIKAGRLCGTDHTATEVMYGSRGRVYARGTMRHAAGMWRESDHAMRRIGDGKAWHLVMRNTVPRGRAGDRFGALR